MRLVNDVVRKNAVTVQAVAAADDAPQYAAKLSVFRRRLLFVDAFTAGIPTAVGGGQRDDKPAAILR
jgi:hypothetical protein